MWSTPGVVLPWFSVTRFTASTLPLNEWGSRALQGFHLAPLPFLYRLHDTRLEPPHIPMGVVPVNGMPLGQHVGSRTSSPVFIHLFDEVFRFRRHLLCLLWGLAKLSRDEKPDGSQLACAWGLLVSPHPLSISLQGGLGFFHLPVPPSSSQLLTKVLPVVRGDVGLPRSASVPG